MNESITGKAILYSEEEIKEMFGPDLPQDKKTKLYQIQSLAKDVKHEAQYGDQEANAAELADLILEFLDGFKND